MSESRFACADVPGDYMQVHPDGDVLCLTIVEAELHQVASLALNADAARALRVHLDDFIREVGQPEAEARLSPTAQRAEAAALRIVRALQAERSKPRFSVGDHVYDTRRPSLLLTIVGGPDDDGDYLVEPALAYPRLDESFFVPSADLISA